MAKSRNIDNEQSCFEISDELLKNFHKPEYLLGSEGIIKQLTKRAIERIMNTEMDHRLDSEKNTEIWPSYGRLPQRQRAQEDQRRLRSCNRDPA